MSVTAKTPEEAIIMINEALEEYRLVLLDKAAADSKSKSYISVDQVMVAMILNDLKKQIQALTDFL